MAVIQLEQLRKSFIINHYVFNDIDNLRRCTEAIALGNALYLFSQYVD